MTITNNHILTVKDFEGRIVLFKRN
uniref:Uncharacterized protein n=1 Tax=Anguilla anguilla TaxID=7936 RepID=A0A0E9P5E3_ANGAN